MHERDDFPNFARPRIATFDPLDEPQADEPEAVDVEAGIADLDSATETEASEAVEPLTAAGDYPILAAPSISLATFASILSAAGSPAASSATGIYNALKKYGVDPAVGLAIFEHESNYGKSGVATKTKSLGNSRYYGDQGLGITKYVTATNGSFAKYPSYTVAAEDLGRLLSSSMYGKSANYSTVRTFAAKYAPAADHNSPSGYGAAVANLLQKWTGSAGSKSAPGGTTKAAVKVTAAPKAAASAAVAKVGALNTNHLLVILAAGGILLLVLLLILRKGKGGGTQTVKIEAAE